jgi:hypothetical protein
MKLPYQSAFTRYLPLAILIVVIALSCRAFGEEVNSHKFLDKNRWNPGYFTCLDKKGIISGSGAVFATDGAITCNYLGTGPYRNHEAFLPIKSCAGIGAWMGASFAAQTSTAYYFHRIGHHRLERMAEIFWSSGSAVGVTYNLTHKPKPQPGAGSAFTIINKPKQ